MTALVVYSYTNNFRRWALSFLFSTENTDQIKLDVVAGDRYFLNVTVVMGWISGRAKISLVRDDHGMKMVRIGKLAKRIK